MTEPALFNLPPISTGHPSVRREERTEWGVRALSGTSLMKPGEIAPRPNEDSARSALAPDAIYYGWPKECEVVSRTVVTVTTPWTRSGGET